MTRTKTSLAGLFANLLAPVTDAIRDETGKRLSTVGWVRMARAAVAGLLRILANVVEPKAEANTQPVAVHLPAPVPVVVEPLAVVDVVPVVEPVAVPVIEVKPAPVAVPVVAEPAKPARKRKPAARTEPKAVPMATAARTTKPTASKPTARPKDKPTAKASKPTKRKLAKVV